MGQFSFDIEDSKGLFEKLEREYKTFLSERSSSDYAINFSITAYHLFEWTDSESDQDQRTELKNMRKEIEEDIQIIRDITNGSKHKETRYIPQLKKAKKHKGAFNSGFSRAFDITVLIAELSDGRQLYFEDIAERIYDFWDKVFQVKKLNDGLMQCTAGNKKAIKHVL